MSILYIFSTSLCRGKDFVSGPPGSEVPVRELGARWGGQPEGREKGGCQMRQEGPCPSAPRRSKPRAREQDTPTTSARRSEGSEQAWDRPLGADPSPGGPGRGHRNQSTGGQGHLGPEPRMAWAAVGRDAALTQLRDPGSPQTWVCRGPEGAEGNHPGRREQPRTGGLNWPTLNPAVRRRVSELALTGTRRVAHPQEDRNHTQNNSVQARTHRCNSLGYLGTRPPATNSRCLKHTSERKIKTELKKKKRNSFLIELTGVVECGCSNSRKTVWGFRGPEDLWAEKLCPLRSGHQGLARGDCLSQTQSQVLLVQPQSAKCERPGGAGGQLPLQEAKITKATHRTSKPTKCSHVQPSSRQPTGPTGPVTIAVLPTSAPSRDVTLDTCRASGPRPRNRVGK